MISFFLLMRWNFNLKDKRFEVTNCDILKCVQSAVSLNLINFSVKEKEIKPIVLFRIRERSASDDSLLCLKEIHKIT